MHFTDFNKTGKGKFRAMNIFINGSYWYGPLVPEYLSDVTLYSTGVINVPNGGKLDISIQRNDSSSLPPIINAIEIYILKQFPQVQTNQAESMIPHNLLCIIYFDTRVHNKFIIIILIHFDTSRGTAERKIIVQIDEKLARRSMLP